MFTLLYFLALISIIALSAMFLTYGAAYAAGPAIAGGTRAMLASSAILFRVNDAGNGCAEVDTSLCVVAAENGDVQAQAVLCQRYRFGDFKYVQPVMTEAVKWCRTAAGNGDKFSQFFLSNMYQDGKGVLRDYAESAKWMLAAARQGFHPAQYHIAEKYSKGSGLEKNLVAAYMWCSLAGTGWGTELEDMVPKFLDELEKSMTPEQIVEAQKAARNWQASHPTTTAY
jgi:TPR repeat protein